MGATCSPLADTSIVSATSGELSIIDHIKTQAPYSLICGAIAIVGYLITGITESLSLGYIIIAALFILTIIIMKRISINQPAIPLTPDKEKFSIAENQ